MNLRTEERKKQWELNNNYKLKMRGESLRHNSVRVPIRAWLKLMQLPTLTDSPGP